MIQFICLFFFSSVRLGSHKHALPTGSYTYTNTVFIHICAAQRHSMLPLLLLPSSIRVYYMYGNKHIVRSSECMDACVRASTQTRLSVSCVRDIFDGKYYSYGALATQSVYKFLRFTNHVRMDILSDRYTFFSPTLSLSLSFSAEAKAAHACDSSAASCAAVCVYECVYTCGNKNIAHIDV